MSEPLRQRRPREKEPAFLAFVRKHPCCVCGTPAPSQAAHIRLASAVYDKRPSGIGEKPDDRWVVPLCAECHLDGPEAQHKVGEVAFWNETKPNPFETAVELWNDFMREKRRG